MKVLVYTRSKRREKMILAQRRTHHPETLTLLRKILHTALIFSLRV